MVVVDGREVCDSSAIEGDAGQPVNVDRMIVHALSEARAFRLREGAAPKSARRSRAPAWATRTSEAAAGGSPSGAGPGGLCASDGLPHRDAAMLLLHIDASPRDTSDSRGLADLFIREWKRKNRVGIVAQRPVGREPPPHVTQDWIAGTHLPPEKRTPAQQQAVATSDKLAEEFLSADVILVSTPMYNLTVPSTLKAYIDQVVRIGKTVKLENGALKGQAVGKQMFVIAAHGGGYPKGSPMASLNHLEPYLRTIFGFVGITDITFIPAEFLDAQEDKRDQALAGAFAEILRVT